MCFTRVIPLYSPPQVTQLSSNDSDGKRQVSGTTVVSLQESEIYLHHITVIGQQGLEPW